MTELLQENRKNAQYKVFNELCKTKTFDELIRILVYIFDYYGIKDLYKTKTKNVFKQNNKDIY